MNLLTLYNDLAQQYGSSTGEMVFTFSDKGSMHSYIEFYEKYFKTKQKSVSLLEVGLMTGGSLHMWQQWFKKYTLVGVDISPTWNAPRPFQHALEIDSNIVLMFGTDSKSPTLAENLSRYNFDFVIDDGDHSCKSQMDTFSNLWRTVSPGGTYFIEDVVGSTQIEILQKFLTDFKDIANVEHYKGFKNGRADDQILAVTKESK